MDVVIFGLTVSSSWGNGHATLWRGLCRALGAAGHNVVFYERDVPYYADHRDAAQPPGCELVLYPEWQAIAAGARRRVARADAAIVTSYCPDAQQASDLVRAACRGARAFYDLDTPVTLEGVEAGERPPYVPDGGFAGFDIVLSFAGGPALDALRTRLNAAAVTPLYGGVDPAVHHPVPPEDRYRSDLAHLGTYAADRRAALEKLFVEPARRSPERRFTLGGAQYPADFPWQPNIWLTEHVPPGEHAAFFSSAELSLNVTRASMVRWGYCPSGRLFEAAACGVAQITDAWEGIESFFAPGSELIVARDPEDIMAALQQPRAERLRIARAAFERVLAEHTLERRARQLVALLTGASQHPARTERGGAVAGA